MAEEAAGVVICCMPATAALFKHFKKPVLSWLSSASKLALRLTSSGRSGHYSNDKGSLESHRDPVYYHVEPQDHHAAWVDAEVDAHSLQQLGQGNTGVWKKTEVHVSESV